MDNKKDRLNSYKKFYFLPVPKAEKNYLVENLTLLLAAGLNPSISLATIKEEISSNKLRAIVQTIKDEVDSGISIWRAMYNANIFNAATIALIRVGEESGRLAENLKIASEHNEKNKQFHSKIKSALLYPSFVIVLAIFVAIGVAWFVLPRLSVVFSQMDTNIPTVTKLLINFGVFLRLHGLLFVSVVFLLLFLTVYFLFFNQRTNILGQKLAFTIPGFRRLIKEVEIGRFGYLLGTLLQAGIPIEDALESVAGAADFYMYKHLALFLKRNIANGNSFQKSFAAYKNLNYLVSGPLQQMIVAGERSGKLSDIFIKIGKSYEDKIELTTKNLVTILEPVFLIVVWLGVVAVAMAVILPIYSLIGSLNSQY